jgi:hypothetical protein
MTEMEWQNQTHAQRMANYLKQCGLPRTKAGRRKLRLFACGCCRVVWDILPDHTLRDAVLTAERFAEGLATKEELAAACTAVVRLRKDLGPFGSASTGVRVAIDMAVLAADPSAYVAAFYMTTAQISPDGPRAAEAYVCHLIRCVFGNPFRSPTLYSSWRTATVVSLAQAIYDEGTFDRLPILADALADALEDAGCASADILSHCRRPGEHCRGCWVVDLLLAKE